MTISKNANFRDRPDIHGSITIVFSFPELVELIQAVDQEEYHTEVVHAAKRKLVAARNAVAKRPRKIS